MFVGDDFVAQAAPLVGHDEVGILPVGHQIHILHGVAVQKHHRVGHHKRLALVVGVDIHLHMNENAVLGGNLHILE